jgi:hypothetical protein
MGEGPRDGVVALKDMLRQSRPAGSAPPRPHTNKAMRACLPSLVWGGAYLRSYSAIICPLVYKATIFYSASVVRRSYKSAKTH